MAAPHVDVIRIDKRYHEPHENHMEDKAELLLVARNEPASSGGRCPVTGVKRPPRGGRVKGL
jgi:hypothetical protein